MGLRIEQKHHILWYAFMTLVMFCYIYQFRLTIFGLPEQLHSIRIAAIFLYVIYGFKLLRSSIKNYADDGRALRFYRKLIIVHILIFFYMLCLYLSIGFIEGTHMVTVLINFFFTTLIPIYLCCKIFDTLDDFFFVILGATLIQTVIIWLCLLIPSIQLLIDYTFNSDIEYYETFRDGYAGGLGCITAPGYIRYSLGQIACFYFYVSRRDVKFLLLYLVLLLTGSMIARTGLLAGGIGLILMIYLTLKGKKIIPVILLLLTATIALFGANQILSNTIVNDFFVGRFYRMATLIEDSKDFGLFNDVFFEGYFNGDNTVIPPLSLETIIGTGVPSGTAGNGIKVNVDGGWYRLYVAYGLVLAILFYLYLFSSMLNETLLQKDQIIKYTLLLTIVFLLIAEFKEWAIYASPFLLFFTVTLLLANRLKIETLSSHSIGKG